MSQKMALLTPIHWDIFADGLVQQKQYNYSVFASDDDTMLELKPGLDLGPMDVFIYISSLDGHENRIFGKGKLFSIFANPHNKGSEDNFNRNFEEHFGNSFMEVKAGAKEFGGEYGWKYYYALKEMKWIDNPLPTDAFTTSKGTALEKGFVVRKPILVFHPGL